MSREYAESRIKEALKLAKGNPTKARQQIIAWATEDARLLRALAQPHMTGIVAHAVNHVIYHLNDDEADIPEAPPVINLPPETFGQEILRALQSGDAARFGREAAAPPAPRRKQASQSHIDALRQIAKKKDS